MKRRKRRKRRKRNGCSGRNMRDGSQGVSNESVRAKRQDRTASEQRGVLEANPSTYVATADSRRECAERQSQSPSCDADRQG